MKVIVIGSGPSGVHFALGALARNHQVTMLDVGNEGPAFPLPNADLNGLKRELEDPVAWFLGEDYAGAFVLNAEDDGDDEYYGLPPSKRAVFSPNPNFELTRDGFIPLVSFGAGGLAECWTAGCYPLNEAELADFPVTTRALNPWYDEVARRIGVGGAVDDLTQDFPIHANLSHPVALDTASAVLLENYEARKRSAVFRYIRMGRSRQATLSDPRGDRNGCSYCGRCLWGCPTAALYTPKLTLAECRKHPAFAYLPGRFVTHLKIDGDGRILEAMAHTPEGHERHRADRFVLAAGTLGSSAILMRSHMRMSGQAPVLRGLMDNRQVLAPFLNLTMIGRAVSPRSYQYHQLAVTIDRGFDARRVHGQITTFSTGQAYSILKSIPTDFASARRVFRVFRNGLGVVNLSFPDTRRPDNVLFLERDAGHPLGRLHAHYRPPEGEDADICAALALLRKAFRKISAPLVPRMTHFRPMGASVHYAGTLPMTTERRKLAVTSGCQSWDHPNLWVVDGSVFPSLPAKNLTFTLMANAARIAATEF